MKKIFMLLLIMLLDISIVGCSGKKYKVTIIGAIDSLMEPLKSSYKAGSKVEIKVYPVTDVTLYAFICDVEIPMSHFDSDYWGYEFTMPDEDITIYLTYNQFYGKDNYKFDELYYWVKKINSDNVKKVSIATHNNTRTSEFISVDYSINRDDIRKLIEMLSKPLTKFDADSQLGYGIEKTIIFYMDEEEYSIRFLNNILTWNSFSASQSFAFTDKKYMVPQLTDINFSTYKFTYDGLSSDIKKVSDDSIVKKYYKINAIEFKIYDGPLLDVEPTYYLDSRYGKIYLINKNIFELNETYYEIITGEDYWAYNRLN